MSMLRVTKGGAGVARVPIRGAPSGPQRTRSSAARASGILTSDRAALALGSLRPVGDRVLVRPREREEATKGGVLLPGGAGTRAFDAGVGTVVAVGGEVDASLGLVAGDLVLFSRFGTSDVDAAEGEAVLVDAKSVLAKLEVGKE